MRLINNDTKCRRSTLAELTFICILTITLYVIMLIFHGIFPFGSKAFIYASDGYSQNLSTLYYVWDCLHGEKSFLYSFSIGYGSNMMGILSHFGMLSPINLIYFFIPRELITESTIWTTLIRLILMGCTLRFFLNRIFEEKLGYGFRVVLCLFYSFSSWTLHYLGFFQWIDVAIVLPIMMKYLMETLFEKKRSSVGYVVSLAMIFIINFQQAYGVLLFIIIFAGFYLPSNIDKEKRINAIFRLGIMTLCAFLISAFVFLPATYQILNSSRNSNGLFSTVKGWLWACKYVDSTYNAEKLCIFSSCFGLLFAIAVILIVRRVLKRQKDKQIVFTLIFLVAAILPVFIESIHYVLQGGTYSCFPLRIGEYLSFSVIYVLAVCLSKESSIFESRVFRISCEIVLMVCFCLSFVISNKSVSAGPFTDTKDMYHYANELHRYDGNPSQRYKNIGFDDNEPMVSGLPSGSNYMHLMSKDVLRTNEELGYMQNWTAVSDRGGTDFTDALLRYAFVLDNQDGIAVTPKDILYPFGVYISDKCELSELSQSKTLFDVQNIICNASLGVDLFSEISNDSTISTNPPGKYYLYFDSDEYPADIEYIVNGKVQKYTDGIAEIDSKDSEFTINVADDFRPQLHLAKFDEETFNSLIPDEICHDISFGKQRLKFSVDNSSKEDKILFIPITNSRGWQCSINGKRSPIFSVVGSYIGITVPAVGESHITISFIPPLFVAGLCLSVIGILILIFIGKHEYNFSDSFILIQKCTSTLFWVAFWGLMTCFVIFTGLTMLFRFI